MDKVDTANVETTIEYRIESINIINYSQNHFSEYGLKSSDIKKGECQIGIDIKIDGNKSCVSIPMKVTMFMEHEGKKCELFSSEAVYTYGIKNFKSLFMKKEPDQYLIPDIFMRTLIGTSLSGMRGIMVASTTIAEYKKILLPLIGTSELLQEIKKKQLEKTVDTNPSKN